MGNKKKLVRVGNLNESEKLLVKEGENFADIFAQISDNNASDEKIVIGKIVAINNGFACIDVGKKSEGLIDLKEFETTDDNGEKSVAVTVGDEVEVCIELLEDKSGALVLSRERAIKEKSWKKLEEIFEQGGTVKGEIVSKVKSGYAVKVDGIIAFLPRSQVDIRPIKDISALVGQEQPFKIVKIKRVHHNHVNVVVSRRALLEESRKDARSELIAKIKQAQVESGGEAIQILEGVVKNITDYGAFVDLGGSDGLIHCTDISWKKISHPSECLTVGQVVRVKVINFNEETGRISLGMKQLEDNPWDGVEGKYAVGSVLKGRVTNITEYGAFVELEPGIEGLVYMTDISWVKVNVHPRKLLSTSQEVQVKVLSVDGQRQRISLGIKQCQNNPWNKFADDNPVGSVIEGEIKNIVDFGFFVGIGEDIDGLVHVSDLSWSEENVANEIKKYKKGDMVKVKVLAIDPSKERVSLGIKQLTEKTIDDVNAESKESKKLFKKGDRVTCEVSAVKDSGIEVSIDGVSNIIFIKKGDLAKDKIEQRIGRFAVGDRVDAKVTFADNNGKIGLSIRALEIDEEERAIAEYGSTTSGASLGEILGTSFKDFAGDMGISKEKGDNK